MRVLLVDDHTHIRRRLRGLLEDYGFTVVGEASTGSSAVRLARELQPEMTLMDLSMPGMGGAAATQAIIDEDPRARILVFTISAEGTDVLDALLAGARGYLLKDAEDAEIVAGLRAAAAGDAIISPTVAPAWSPGCGSSAAPSGSRRRRSRRRSRRVSATSSGCSRRAARTRRSPPSW